MFAAAVVLCALLHAAAHALEPPFNPSSHLTGPLRFELHPYKGDPTCNKLFPPTLRNAGYLLNIPVGGVEGGDPLNLAPDMLLYNDVQCDVNGTGSPLLFPDELPELSGEDVFSRGVISFLGPSSTAVEWGAYGYGSVPCSGSDEVGTVTVERILIMHFITNLSRPTVTEEDLVFEKGRTYMSTEQRTVLPEAQGRLAICIFQDVVGATEDLDSPDTDSRSAGEEEEGDAGISSGRVTGIVVGGLGSFIGIGIVVFAGVFWRRQRRRNAAMASRTMSSDPDAEATSASGGGAGDVEDQNSFSSENADFDG